MASVNFSIYIPSKGRATTCLTPRLLLENNVPFTLVVEPQDHGSYLKAFPDTPILVLRKNDQAIAYARRCIKNFSTKSGESWHWQFDDDLKSFKHRIDGKNIAVQPSDILPKIENYVLSYDNIGIAALRHHRWAWSQKTNLSFNNQCASFVLIKNDELRWRDDVIEDTDYSMQVLSSGLCTVIFNRFIYEARPTGTAEGGNTELYKIALLQQGQKLQEYWPGAFQIRDKLLPGGQYIKPSRIWKTFLQRPGETIK